MTAQTDTKLPEWPALPHGPNALALRTYERARADAWEARCRVAVECLRGVNVLSSVRTKHSGGRWATHHEDYERNTAEILALIGPLPLPQMPTPLPGEGE